MTNYSPQLFNRRRRANESGYILSMQGRRWPGHFSVTALRDTILRRIIWRIIWNWPASGGLVWLLQPPNVTEPYKRMPNLPLQIIFEFDSVGAFLFLLALWALLNIKFVKMGRAARAAAVGAVIGLLLLPFYLAKLASRQSGVPLFLHNYFISTWTSKKWLTIHMELIIKLEDVSNRALAIITSKKR